MLDMAAVVHMIQPTTANTFLDYVSMCFVPHLESQLAPTVIRVDAVWDYSDENLKTLKHPLHGLDPCTRIGDRHTLIPNNDWNARFLKSIDNERELFPCLIRESVKLVLKGRLLITPTC